MNLLVAGQISDLKNSLDVQTTHHSCRALDDLPGLALLVDLAEPSPLAQLHVGVHLDQGDSVLLQAKVLKSNVPQGPGP